MSKKVIIKEVEQININFNNKVDMSKVIKDDHTRVTYNAVSN